MNDNFLLHLIETCHQLNNNRMCARICALRAVRRCFAIGKGNISKRISAHSFYEKYEFHSMTFHIQEGCAMLVFFRYRRATHRD